MLDRALDAMAQVIAVLEQQSHTVAVAEEGRIVALINGEQIRFAIEEPVRKVVTSKPRVPNPTDRWDYDEIVAHEPTGKLVLAIETSTWGQFEQRKRWSDAKTQRVENLIADFVAGLLRTAVSLRRQKEEQEQQEAERKRQEAERWQLRKDIEQEEKKVEQLNKWAENWERANRMRRFIKAYEKQYSSWPSEKQAKYKTWIEWATQQADRIDPLVTEKPASVLDRKHELSWW
jgi:nitrate reductase NapAB chaperone NapD